jgi:hypothetical protein
MIEGRCNCSSVSFAIDAEPKEIYVCHCSICRRWTGNNGVAVIIVPNEKFRWITGQEQVACWTKPDADWQSWFCRICGSALPGANDELHMFVPAGLLQSNTADLRIAHHIWVDSKASWDEISGDGKIHPKEFQN